MIPRMADSGGHLAADIKGLRPSRVIDETPAGRAAGIDHDTDLVYAEMHQLLTGDVTGMSGQEYADQLADLAGMLIDLHKRTEQAFDEACVRSWGW